MHSRLVATLLLVLASSVAARPLTLSSPAYKQLCPLLQGWNEAAFAPQALRSINNACPNAAAAPQIESCIPCLCGSLSLFGSTLALPTVQSDIRLTTRSPLNGDTFNSCIQEHADKFIRPIQIQLGLSKCLLAQDLDELLATCTTWQAQFLDIQAAPRTEARLLQQMEESSTDNETSAAAELSRDENSTAEISSEESSAEASSEESSAEESSTGETSMEESSVEESSMEESSAEESSMEESSSANEMSSSEESSAIKASNEESSSEDSSFEVSPGPMPSPSPISTIMPSPSPVSRNLPNENSTFITNPTYSTTPSQTSSAGSHIAGLLPLVVALVVSVSLFIV